MSTYSVHCITDEATCYKMFRISLLRSLPLCCSGFEFCPEVTACVAQRGIQIHEIPIHYTPRSKAEGKKIRFRHGTKALWTLVNLWLNSPLLNKKRVSLFVFPLFELILYYNKPDFED